MLTFKNATAAALLIYWTGTPRPPLTAAQTDMIHIAREKTYVEEMSTFSLIPSHYQKRPARMLGYP